MAHRSVILRPGDCWCIKALCFSGEERLGDIPRTTGQGSGRSESRTQVPYSQLYRVLVLLHNVTAPHLPRRGGIAVIKIRIEAELLKTYNDNKEDTGHVLSCVTFGDKVVPSHWGATFCLNFLEHSLT